MSRPISNFTAVKFEISRDIIWWNYVATYFEFYRDISSVLWLVAIFYCDIILLFWDVIQLHHDIIQLHRDILSVLRLVEIIWRHDMSSSDTNGKPYTTHMADRGRPGIAACPINVNGWFWTASFWINFIIVVTTFYNRKWLSIWTEASLLFGLINVTIDYVTLTH